MSITCLNCGTEITDKFCPHCGQKKEVKKLTWHSLIQEIVHFFSHIEHGFLNTSYQLLIHPGKVIREYLDGKRIKYQKPISLFLIWVTIQIITFNLVANLMGYENLRTKGNFLFGTQEAGNYIRQYTNVFGLLLLPIVVLFVWLLVARPKMNYIETLVVGIYFFAANYILIFIQNILTGLLFKTNFLTNSFLIQMRVVTFVWGFYCLMDFFRKEKIKFLAIRILLAQIIAVVVYDVLSVVIADLILSFKN